MQFISQYNNLKVDLLIINFFFFYNTIVFEKKLTIN